MEVPYEGLIRWDGATVKEGLELDSATVTQLDSYCEVRVVEVACVESGRERLRIETPVEGWVSAMFVSPTEGESSSETSGDRGSDVAPRRRPRQQMSATARGGGAAPLSESLLKMIAKRSGNDTCYGCATDLARARGPDGELGWADVTQGTLYCGTCGEAAWTKMPRCLRSLDLDAWSRSQYAAALLGGNAQFLRYLERHANEQSAPELYAAELAKEACVAAKLTGVEDTLGEILRRNDGASLGPAELAVVVERDSSLGFSVVEVHGGRCAIWRVADDSPAERAGLRAGDYVVGIGDKRVWRYKPVLERIGLLKESSSLRLLIRRPEIDDAFEALDTYYEQEQEEEEAAPPVVEEEAVAEEEEEEAPQVESGGGPGGGGPGEPGCERSFATHSRVVGYWDEEEEVKKHPEVKQTSERRVVKGARRLCCFAMGEGEPLAAQLKADDKGRPVLRGVDTEKLPHVPEGSVVVRINSKKAPTLEEAVACLSESRRPLLVSVVAPRLPVPRLPGNYRRRQVDAPLINKVSLPRGPLGLRLTERFLGRTSVAHVEHVEAGAAAWQAGVRPGSFVRAVNGVTCRGHAHTLSLLQESRRPALVELEPVDLPPLPRPLAGIQSLRRGVNNTAKLLADRGQSLIDGFAEQQPADLPKPPPPADLDDEGDATFATMQKLRVTDGGNKYGGL